MKNKLHELTKHTSYKMPLVIKSIYLADIEGHCCTLVELEVHCIGGELELELGWDSKMSAVDPQEEHCSLKLDSTVVAPHSDFLCSSQSIVPAGHW